MNDTKWFAVGFIGFIAGEWRNRYKTKMFANEQVKVQVRRYLNRAANIYFNTRFFSLSSISNDCP